MRVAAAQFDVITGDPQANRESFVRLAGEAASLKPPPDVIVFPEMWNTGYSLENIRDLADRDGEPTRTIASRLCRRFGVNIIAGSIADLRDGRVFNTAYVFDRDGKEAGCYSKIHRFRPMEEHKYLEAGDRSFVFDLDGIRCGLVICYDIRFPELARGMALKDAAVMFVPAQWPHPRVHHWKVLQMARAIENQMYVVGCNRVGESAGLEFFGSSMVSDPWGEVVAEAGQGEQIIVADVDLSLVERVRRTIPVFVDRRPDVYEKL
ncbi:MAG: carbon-nitrogen family hydrolase [Ignavibacteriales bacterium]